MASTAGLREASGARDASEASASPGDARPFSPAPALQYAANGAVSVRGFRLLVTLTLVNTALLASLVLGPNLARFARGQWQQWKDARAAAQRLRSELAAQQQCRTYAAPATAVVYEEDPAEVMKLVTTSPAGYAAAVPGSRSAPPGWVPPVRAAPPAPYIAFLKALEGSTPGAVIFLHERTSPRGARSLVSIDLHANVATNRQSRNELFPSSAEEVRFKQVKERSLVGHWWPIGTNGPSVDARGQGKTMRLRLSLPDDDGRVIARVKPDAPLEPSPAIDYGNKLRFYAGQADPADASHFTIGYEVDGRKGTIDGWLRDDGVELRPREGSLVYKGSGEAWRLPAAAPPPEGP